ncbi:MAG: hypothetical protein HY711_10185 [Candidatus Melainabacteria bacterium]|nr:hypothetical protein [Candidatus Melainabacteria bacterium]
MDHPVESGQLSETSNELSLGTRLWNEAYVISHGLTGTPQAFKEAAIHAYENPGSTALQIGVGTAFGLGIGYLSARVGAVGLVTRGIAASAGLSFIDEGVKPWRTALSQAWVADTNTKLDLASQQLSKKVGQFAFDTVIVTPGTVGGTLAGAKLRLHLTGARTKVGPTTDKALGITADQSTLAGSEVAPIAADTSLPTRIRPYRYVTVKPGHPANKRFDFGIEISDPRLLSSQPNLDHHRVGDTAQTLSACEQALLLPDSQLPKPGSVLATIRIDRDSLTAMAVLANRLEGRPVNERLVEAIGRRDRGLRDLIPDDLRDPMDAIQFTARSNRELHKQVFFVKDVLDGTVNQELLATLARRNREVRRDVHAAIEQDLNVQVILPGKLALVESDSTAALLHGYDYADVVVLHNQNGRFRRFTVGVRDGSNGGQYLPYALRELSTLEPGWGGRGSSIFGSPQNTDTTSTPEQVIAIVQKYIDPPVYRRYWLETLDFLRQRPTLRRFFKED